MSKLPKRVTTPSILQMEAVECGAATLAMILAYHGRLVPIEQLRADCGVSRDGSKASNILRAARAYGLDAKGYRKEPAALRTMSPPSILHWNFNHFVVLDGFSRRGVHLNDPASGPLVVTEDELDQSFTGVALTFTRGSAFARGGYLPSFVASLKRRLATSGAALAFVVAAGLGLIVPGLVGSSFTKIFIDEILTRQLVRSVKPFMLAMFAVAIAIFAITALQQKYLLRLENRLSLHGSSRFFWHVLSLPIQFFTQRYAGDIANRLTINETVSKLLSGEMASTAVSFVLAAFYCLLLFQYNAVLASVALVAALLNLVALKYAGRRRVYLTQRLANDRGKFIGTAMSGLQTIDTLKATGAESDFFTRWAGQQAKVALAQQELQIAGVFLLAVPPLLMTLNTALVLGIGGAQIMDGKLTVGMLVAFEAVLAAFLSPVNRMVEFGGTLLEVKGDMLRLDDVLLANVDRGRGRDPFGKEIPSAKLSGLLELRDVTFGYSPLDPPLIEGFNLTLSPGRRVALVGGSGSGKSTVARLVAGLHEAWSGEVLFDGRPRHEIPRDTLIQSLSMVDQDISLFEGTVAENLTLWDETITEVSLARAAADACLDMDTIRQAGGYWGPVEEGGRNFSGGQRQRMEIARALATDPTILVLDEATSALDPTTEKALGDHLRLRGCTCVIVAHRLSTIRDCDEILVLDKGVVVQRGTHDELIAVAGPYRALITSEEA
jgi:NHLM bacteriocin system ABC transporter peptidase/ATP-binding protein